MIYEFAMDREAVYGDIAVAAGVSLLVDCSAAERLGGLASWDSGAHGKDSQQPGRFYVDIRVDEHLAAND